MGVPWHLPGSSVGVRSRIDMTTKGFRSEGKYPRGYVHWCFVSLIFDRTCPYS